MTWPLALGVARDVPGDLGDSLLNMWILGWGAEHVPRVVTGQMSLGDFWNANIFHPEPLALSFSEHLFGQVLQILPVYHLTGNLILSYNVLFLSSFVLSGLGMYLLVRDLLGARPGAHQAAFVAGVIYAFVPLRIAQVAHIQSLSSQWMPFALYGFRRFIAAEVPFSRAGLLPLVGGTAALLMQNWSCGYYLVYFAPFVVLVVVHQILASGRARDWRVWASFAAAAAIAAAGTWPFLMLYLEGQRVHGIERSMGEVIRFSADVYSYFTAPAALCVWGDIMQAYPKPEGELFFGVVPMVLMVVALVAGLKAGPTTVGVRVGEASVVGPAFRRARSTIAIVLTAVILIQLAGLIGILLTGGFVTSFLGLPIRATNPGRLAAGIVTACGLLLAISPRARQALRVAAGSPLTLAVVLTGLAVWLSLGPLPQSRGRALPGLGLYGVLYNQVPGFDGLRVPARYAMVAAVFLSIVAGYGVAALMKRVTRRALVAGAIAALFLIESAFAPMPINLSWGDGGVAPPARVEPRNNAPAVYRALVTLPDARVIAEFPFGDAAWELRAVYYSTVHWKRLLNGYSGAFPQSYKIRVARLQRIADDPAAAWQTLRDAGTTHVIVHEAAYVTGEAEKVETWLAANGATEVARFEIDVLYSLR